MKRYTKLHLLIAFCIAMVFFLPLTTQNVYAGDDVFLSWTYTGEGNGPIQVEKGVSFYLSDYVDIMDGFDSGSAALFPKAKYSSSNKKVAVLNSKGLLTAKNVGTTTVKIKYKGKTLSTKIKVVKKGTLSKQDEVKELQKEVDAITSSFPSKIKRTNALKYIKLLRGFYEKQRSVVSSSGFLFQTRRGEGVSVTYMSKRLAVPDAGRLNTINSMLYVYARKHTPVINLNTSKNMELVSATGNTKQITAKVKKAVTEDQVLATNILEVPYNPSPNNKTGNFAVNIHDVTTDEYLMGIGTLKKGSKTVIIKPFPENSKFKKGHTYAIEYSYSWGKGKKVKIK